MVMASVFMVCATSASATVLTITSHDGWHMSYEHVSMIPGPHPDVVEWRNFGGSWFECQMGALREELRSAYTDWWQHTLPSATGSEAFYTWAGDDILDWDGEDLLLVRKWNTTTLVGDIRACLPRSQALSESLPCRPNSDFVADSTDCPFECFEDKKRCRFKFLDEECVQDVRCVPLEARDPAHQRTRPLDVEGNRCLEAHHGNLTAGPCDNESIAQQWTFAPATEVALVV